MRVLIVGGGVAGLALAAELARQGREPLVLERAASHGEHGFSVSRYPYGSAVLQTESGPTGTSPPGRSR